MIEVRRFTGSNAFAQNGYLAVCRDHGVALVIDPGAAASSILRSLEEEALDVAAIVLTHAHLDHLEGVAAVKKATGADVYLHPDDRPLYDRASDQAAAFDHPLEAPPPPDRALAHGDVLEFGGCTLEVRHAPGHSPGHVILVSETDGLAFVADVVFQGSIGRTDLPGGDFHELMRSIREQVLSLPDETRLLPGHGPETTVGHERVGNPFLVPHYGGEFA